jgi:hypothetical protein
VALLPNVDLVVGQVVGDALQKGQKVSVSGSITRQDDPAYKDNIDFRMEVDAEKQQIVTTGRFGPHECWADPGTHVVEKGTINMDEMSYNISGYVGTSVEGDQADNESLKTVPGMGEITMTGKLDQYNVDQKISIDPFAMSVTHEGNIAGHDFSRTIKPQSVTESSIEGKYGSLEEKGTITLNDDGSIAIIRDFGPYHVQEKVSFE